MKQLLVFLFLLCAASVSAQDVIVKKDGSTVVCRVVELSDTEITYKKWSDLNGSNYVMDRSLASAINYQSGKKVNLSEATNLYMPNNQNDGTQQYNDNELLAIYHAGQQEFKNIKKQRILGWISGIAAIGIVTGLAIRSQDPLNNAGTYYLGGGLLATGGIATSIYCFISAHKKQKQAENYLQSSTIYQYDISFPNKSSLSVGADMLSNRTLGINTIGLGLRYNF